MGTTAKKIFGIVLLTAVVLISNRAAAQGPTQAVPAAAAKEDLLASVPDIADITPLATQLSGRLAAIENQIVDLSPNVSKFEKKLAVIEENLKRLADQLSQLKDSKAFGINKLVTVREAIKREDLLLDESSSSLRKNIRQAGVLRKEWLAEKKRWSELQSHMRQEGMFDQFKPTFAKANETIDSALNLILPRFNEMLAMQAKVGNIQIKIYSLVEELNGRIMAQRRGALTDKFLPMLSIGYFSQFNSELWYEVIKGLNDIPWPDSRFFAQSGWVIILQAFLSLFMLITILRNRKVLKVDNRWQLIAARPYSAALFMGCMGTLAL